MTAAERAAERQANERCVEAWYAYRAGPHYQDNEGGRFNSRIPFEHGFDAGAAWQAEQVDVDALAEAKARAYHDSECVWKAQAEQARPVLTREQIEAALRGAHLADGTPIRHSWQEFDALTDALLAQGDVPAQTTEKEN